MHFPAKTVKHAKIFFLYALTAVMLCSLFPLHALAENRQPMDPSVMQPWMNSSIIGMVTEDTTADCRDDYYLSVNHDWLLNTKLYPGYSSETGMIHKTMRDVRERCIALVTDKTLTGQDADLIQAYYELWLDWESAQ